MRLKLDQILPSSDNPLAYLLENGGYTSVFRRIGCIGDSLSSGELESDASMTHRWHDYFEYSWGQFLSRMTGTEVFNFSIGGLSAKGYCESFASQHGYWDKKYVCQAYIMALGVNDLLGKPFPVGTVDDICMDDCENNADSFAGWYGKIIQRYKQMEPNSFFFLVTMPMDPELPEEQQLAADAHATLMYRFAEKFRNTYVIDLRKYGPIYDAAFKERFYLRSHMNPAGYYLTAQMIATYIDYIIRSNYAEFSQVGFIGTPYYKDGYHWKT